MRLLNRYKTAAPVALLAMGLTLLATGCADTDRPEFSVDEPQSLYLGDSLNAYGVVKSYVDSVKYPNFIIGCGVNAESFNSQNIVYALAKSNFKEVVAGNAFKYASIVKDDGTMDFSTVQKFTETATNAGLGVYGHTLCWHSQQNVKYLNSLITDPNAANYVVHVNIPEAKANLWDHELYFNLTGPLTVGKEYTLKMRIKASKDFSLTIWPQVVGGATQYWPTPSATASTNWTNVTSSFQANNAIDQIRFELGPFDGEMWINDFHLTDADGNEFFANSGFDENIEGVTKPSWHNYTLNRVQDPDQGAGGGSMTAEFKRDTLTVALGSFIQGIMEATGGKVKAWDVVNEPMSDAVPTELKTAGRDGDPKTNFYWQDYLGKDYARTAVRLARQYGGDDLKLFINDYNLEAAYNHNAKCQGLIDMVKYWESDGVTRIDGIGTQMHVTYSLDPATQKRNEDAYVNMLNLLAASGKLVRISELDMGIADANGKTISTDNVTTEQLKAMANYYRFIVSKYLEIIPANQQYGISQWGLTDSPKGSGWRAGEPVGLWNGNYVRKPAYAGVCQGLAQ